MSDATYDVARLRAAEFPWSVSGKQIYLNNAGTGPLPQRTADRLQQWAQLRTQPWTVSDRDVVFPALANVRELGARLLGARASEIALVPNTSFGLSLAARSLPLQPGDEVLVSDKEFPSVIYAWRAVERQRGIRLRVLPARGGLLDEQALMAALDDPRVRAVTVSWVSFATGYRLHLRQLGAACRERGIYLVVDAMQGLGGAALDVRDCGADIVACGGYKWLLSPWGTALLYVRDELIRQLQPPVVGWFVGPASEDYSRLLDYDLAYFDDARRFEVMTLPSQDFAAMGCSLELLLELGLPAVETHIRRLTGRIVQWALARGDIRLVTPADAERRAGIVAIVPPRALESSQRLTEAGVMHSFREGAIRLAPHCYNTVEEVDFALSVLAES
jgi:selenocysteine lyase/cysteine desulfurase